MSNDYDYALQRWYRIISRYKIKVYKWNEHHPIRSNKLTNRFSLFPRFIDLFYEYECVTEIGILIDALMNIQQVARYKFSKNSPQRTARFVCAEYDTSDYGNERKEY